MMMFQNPRSQNPFITRFGDTMYEGATYVYNYGGSTTFIVPNVKEPLTQTMPIGLGWKEAEEAEQQDIQSKVERAKKKKTQEVKDVKRLVMGPKASRWK